MKAVAARFPIPHRFLAILLLSLWLRTSQAQQLAWQAPVGTTSAYFVATDGTVFLADNSGTLRAFDSMGTVTWTLALDSEITGKLAPTGDGGFALSTGGGHLVVVEKTGAKRWDKTLPTAASGAPAVANSAVYVAAGTQLFAYKLTDGSLLWSYDTGSTDFTFSGTPDANASAVAAASPNQGVVVLSPQGNHFFDFITGDSPAKVAVGPGGTFSYLLNDLIVGVSATGVQTWDLPPDDGTAYDGAKALVKDGTIYVADGSLLKAVGPDGKVAWSFNLGAASNVTLATPILLNEASQLELGTSDNRILVLGLDGSKKLEVQAPTAFTGAWALQTDHFYLLTGSEFGGTASGLLSAYLPTDPNAPAWTASGLSGQAALDIAHHPDLPHTFVAVGNSFVLQSDDDGKTWQPVAISIPQGDSSVNSVSLGSDGGILASTLNYLFYKAPGDTELAAIPASADVGVVAINPKDPTEAVYNNTVDPYFYLQMPVDSSAGQEDAPAIFTRIVWAGDETLYAAAEDGLYRRPKGGAWTKIAEGPVYDIAASPDGKTVFVGAASADGSARILTSSDFGANFTDLGAKQLVGAVYRIALNPADLSELVAGTVIPGGKLSNSGIRGVNIYHSTDGGANWAIVDKGLNSLNPHSLSAGEGVFLLGTDQGIFRLAASSTPTVKLGDVNMDGQVNVADAVMTLRAAVGQITLTAEQKQAADVNGDASINVADAVKILRVAVGLDHF